MNAADYRRRFEEGIRANQMELAMPYSGLDVRRIDLLTRALLHFPGSNDGDELERRAADGRIVDAHGDLRPEHICLTPEPVIIDCLEFNEAFRLLDPVDELAYLAIECERLGAAAVGASVLQRYLDATGDRATHQLIRFYKAYRACLRAKLAIWHIPDHGTRHVEMWRRRARDYLALAETCAAGW
jgi:aminoglycoside phosphotransferase family enzyme